MIKAVGEFIGELLVCVIGLFFVVAMIKFRAWNMPFGKDGPMQNMMHDRAGNILALAEMQPEKYIAE